MADLKDPRGKVERAEEHLKALDRDILAFQRDNPCRVRHYEDLDKALYIVRSYLPIVPQRFGLIAGDAIHNLRSALDHLVWQLALTKPERPFDRTEFPIVAKDTPENRAYFKRVTQSVPDEALPIIKELQPYQRGARYKDDPLWQLDKLWNIDKHRVIPVHGIRMNIKAPRGATPELLTFDDYAEMRMPIAFKPQMQLAPAPSAAIIFGSDIDGLTIPAERLGQIYNYVANTVLPRFASFFT